MPFNCFCQCLTNANTSDGTNMWSVVIPAIVAIINLIVTIIFTVFVAPRIAEKSSQRASMYKICTDFFDYLTDLVSFDNFDNVPSTIRRFSMKIHFMFISGTAPASIANKLENVFQQVKKRKVMQDSEEIAEWEESYRLLVRELRKDLAKYVGVLKEK